MSRRLNAFTLYDVGKLTPQPKRDCDCMAQYIPSWECKCFTQLYLAPDFHGPSAWNRLASAYILSRGCSNVKQTIIDMGTCGMKDTVEYVKRERTNPTNKQTYAALKENIPSIGDTQRSMSQALCRWTISNLLPFLRAHNVKASMRITTQQFTSVFFAACLRQGPVLGLPNITDIQQRFPGRPATPVFSNDIKITKSYGVDSVTLSYSDIVKVQVTIPRTTMEIHQTLCDLTDPTSATTIIGYWPEASDIKETPLKSNKKRKIT